MNCCVSTVDVVVRAHFYKYFHPKEALVSNGVLNRCCNSCWSARLICVLIVHRVTSCLENLEMSGKFTAVRKVSGILLKVRKVSGKNRVREKWPKTFFIVSCIFASVLDFAGLVHFILVLDHALLHSYPYH